jgi:23S rRNA pseudouridine1911/1915/1917 synthase
MWDNRAMTDLPRGAYGDPRAVSSRWAVPPDGNGLTPAEALAHKVRRLGVERAHSVVAAGDFRIVEGDATRVPAVDERLVKGTVIELWRLPPDDPEDIVEAPTILHHDDGILVVDKPGDLAVHPTARYLHATLTSWLRKNGTPANPCHRLDRETSGVLVCADDGVAERRWKQGFAAGKVKKQYLAVVDGVLDAEQRIDLPLALQGDRGLVRIKMVVDVDGAPSVTRVEPVAVNAARTRSLVRCHPETGRQHQLRAHLAAIGHPIVGDKLYQMGEVWFDAFTRSALSDEQKALLTMPRHCLHAARVELDDEVYEAPLPSSFQFALG